MAFGVPEAATDPLMTIAELKVWTEREIPAEDPLATFIINGMSVEVRAAGSSAWTYATLPPRARNVMHIATKNYYLNRTGNRQESIGPLQESKAAGFSENFALTEAQALVLATLAGNPLPGSAQEGAVWVQPVGDGLEDYEADVFVTDQYGSDWMIPWARLGDSLYPRF